MNEIITLSQDNENGFKASWVTALILSCLLVFISVVIIVRSFKTQNRNFFIVIAGLTIMASVCGAGCAKIELVIFSGFANLSQLN